MFSAGALLGLSFIAADETPETLQFDASLLDCRWHASKLDVPRLPNAVQVAPTVISGGLPEGEAGFAELKTLGVKTVISVDGMKPDVKGARKHGLRYVHLPHGYDGIPEARVQALAKAVRDLPGPIYIHCHHGKHRSPAAAVAACVTAGLLDETSASGILELAGTGRNYVGLYRDARNARRIDPAQLDALEADFPEVAKLPPMAEAMVEIEHSFDRMKQVAAAGWKTPKDHPDVDPAHEALILREQFTELLRSDDVKERPAKFRELLRRGERHGEALEASLHATGSASSLSRAKTALDGIAANCAACHKAYRDAPPATNTAE
ncbi:MAG: hypothetical protein M3552_00970 [Planctomycetota bacterium]|nr:hypothetical protein [Planctomycetaceae bacterium]MDQ3329217.1 hypothetical protein [Planctomycetota bacterium]